jgi:CubicO group peptidase (beta-lactamase class C family)
MSMIHSLLRPAMSLSLVLFASNLQALPIGQETIRQIDAHFRREMRANNIQGLSATLSLPNGDRLSRFYGMENLEYGMEISARTIFGIGSVTKLFTAVAIKRLEQSGRLSVDDVITKYFPDAPQWTGITIKNLLQHTSGLPDISAIQEINQYQNEDWTPLQVLEFMKALPLSYPTGTKALYTNTAFILLGFIIEQASGMSYWDYVDQQIVEPLALKKTSMGSNTRIVNHRAASYIIKDGAITNAGYASLVLPFSSGAILSTTADLVLMAGAFRPGVLLTKASVDQMVTPVVLNDGQEGWLDLKGAYGVRWSQMSYGCSTEILRDQKGSLAYTKSGQIAGFNNYLIYYPDSRIGVAITSNTAGTFSVIVKAADWLEKTVRRAVRR